MVQAGNSALHYHLNLKPVARRCGDNQRLLGIHIHTAGAIKADGANHTDRHAEVNGLKTVSHPPGQTRLKSGPQHPVRGLCQRGNGGTGQAVFPVIGVKFSAFVAKEAVFRAYP